MDWHYDFNVQWLNCYCNKIVIKLFLKISTAFAYALNEIGHKFLNTPTYTSWFVINLATIRKSSEHIRIQWCIWRYVIVIAYFSTGLLECVHIKSTTSVLKWGRLTVLFRFMKKEVAYQEKNVTHLTFYNQFINLLKGRRKYEQ